MGTVTRYGAAIAVFCCAALAYAETTYVVETPRASSADIDAYSAAGYIVDHVQPGSATLYLTGVQLWELDVQGHPYTLVEIQDGTVPKGANNGMTLGTYMSYDTITTLLQNYAAANPDLCRLTSIGQSVEGRELWHVLVTDNPGVEEAEPEFKYVGNMHGDETVGSVVLLYLIDLLLNQYGTDPRITALVDTTSISIVPHMNPDGYEAVRRANANGFDLNRSFPQWSIDFNDTMYDGEPLGDAGRQPEVAAIMQWSASNSFVLSANLHTGALLVNYPLDYAPGVPSGQYAAAPDDTILIRLSEVYSEPNLPMYNSPFYTNGITNGSAWFSITGGMQDWNYWYLSCIEVTLELSDIKRPSEASLPGFWEDNRESLLRYLESVHTGIRGIVRDMLTGDPVYARVRVKQGGIDVFSDTDIGDYYRVLLPGTYTLTFSSPGYASKSIEGIVVNPGPPTFRDVALLDADNPADLDNSGTNDSGDVQAIINAVLGLGDPVKSPDVNNDGSTDAADIQAVINAVLL